MKPSNRQELKAIHRLALEARQGRAVERGDGRSLYKLLKSLFGWAFAGFIAAVFLGVFDTRPSHWVGLMGAMLLMAVVVLSSGAFYNTAIRMGYNTVLVNLPVPGETSLGWIRENFFREFSPKLIGSSLLVALAAHGFSFANPLQIAATSLLLFTTTTATVPLLDDPWLRKICLKLVWIFVYVISGLMLIYFMFRNNRVFEPRGSAEWLINLVTMVTWIFPQGWVMPGRFESGGAFLAIPWCAWGLHRWISLPRDMGAAYDRPQDYATAFGSFGLDEEWDEGYEEDFGRDFSDFPEDNIPSDHAVNEPDGAAAFEALKVRGETTGGWVDDFVLGFLNSRYRMIAYAMNDGRIDSTSLTHFFLKFSAIWLPALWLLGMVLSDHLMPENGKTWLGIISFVITVFCLFPITNGLPMASRWWQMGAQAVPFFALLPITARDIVKISTRMSLARCLVMFPIGSIFLILVAKMIGGEEFTVFDIVTLFGSVTLVWILSRPIFVWYSLQSMARRRSGVRLGHLLYQAMELIFCLVWLAGSAGCVICVFVLSILERGVEFNETLVILAVCALCCFVGARAAFEIFYIRLRYRKYDWLSQGLNSDQ